MLGDWARETTQMFQSDGGVPCHPAWYPSSTDCRHWQASICC